MAKYKITPSSRSIVRQPIPIGHRSEKGVQAIEFDVTAWVETYGSGTLTVVMKRWGDENPYPIALEIDENNKATWTFSDTDTAKPGMAYAQLSYVVGDTIVKKSDVYTLYVMDSLTGEGEPPEAYESWLEQLTRLAAEAMAEVLDIEGIATDKTLSVDGGIADAKATGDALALKANQSTTYTKTEVDALIESDTTLSVSGKPADAKKTGDEISAIKADLDAKGLTPDIKEALLQLAQKVAYIDDDGQDYYDYLYNALYPPADLVSISAVYTQSGTVYEGSSINSLKSDLVVTALMSDQTTQTVTNYTLFGTLTAGTSTITVSYGGKTTTFTVTVSALTYVQDGLVMWLDGEKNGADGAHEATLTTWVDQTGNGWDWTNYGATVGEKSVIFADSAHLDRNRNDLPQNVAMMEVVLKYSNTGTSMGILTGFGRDVIGNITISVSSGLLIFHTGTEQGVNTSYAITNGVIHTANSAGYLDGESAELATSAADWQYKYPCIGVYRGSSGSAAQYPFVGEIYCIRLYNRVLTEQEILHNASIDMQRFGIGA